MVLYAMFNLFRCSQYRTYTANLNLLPNVFRIFDYTIKFSYLFDSYMPIAMPQKNKEGAISDTLIISDKSETRTPLPATKCINCCPEQGARSIR